MLSIDDIQRQADQLLADIEPGDLLDAEAKALVGLAVAVSVTSLDQDAIRATIADARAAGVSDQQIQEVISLVSGLGVHSLMMTSVWLLGGSDLEQPLDEKRAALWTKYVGDDPYWAGFEAEFPGFLLSLLHLSPPAFRGFFDYCAIPWATRSVRALIKELVAMACDATPTHRFGPGFRLHLKNALQLGAGGAAIREALDIARNAPLHNGIA